MEDRLYAARQWHTSDKTSVLIIGYEMLQIYTKSPEDATAKTKKLLLAKPKPKSKKTIKDEKMKVEFRKYFLDPGM